MSSLNDTFLKLLTTSPIIFGVRRLLLLDRGQVKNGHGFNRNSLNKKEKKKNKRNEEEKEEKKDRIEAADKKSIERER
ncbi:hypothetical protein N7467_001071 [Penicillium canescens]|nr:hypothetical protein N7467_001071 [Penicillium canescens]